MKISDNQNLSDGLEIVIARSLDEIEAIRPVWEEMQSNQSYPVINADIDRYLSVIKANSNDMRPHIMLFKRDGHPVMMVVGRIEKHHVELKLAYKTFFRPTLRCLTVVYGGILGQPTNDLCASLIDKLLVLLRRHEFDMVFFNELRTDSMIYRFAKEEPNFLCRGHFTRVSPHWTMSIPNSMELFYELCSPSSRKQYRKCIRKIEKAFPGRVRVTRYTREDQLDQAVQIASRISSRTYQHGMGAGVVDNPQLQTLLATAAQLGWLRLHILFVGDEACAFELWLQYGKVYFGHGIGFDPKWEEWRVGTVLFLRTIEHATKDSTVNTVDFGFGDAQYKRHYADRQWQEASVYIFAPRLYPVAVNMLRTSTMGLNASLEYILNKTGLTGWIKRRWRNSLQVAKDNRH